MKKQLYKYEPSRVKCTSASNACQMKRKRVFVGVERGRREKEATKAVKRSAATAKSEKKEIQEKIGGEALMDIASA